LAIGIDIGLGIGIGVGILNTPGNGGYAPCGRNDLEIREISLGRILFRPSTSSG
jgi:hypothetical protein